ncbi:MAG: hypothetical protein OEU36_10435 [Gammaproteobacteria bacterium]|nr:hypothetical protein [Gammaproteobacteria bacterium]
MSRIDIAVVHAHQLTKRYSDVEVVRGIDFQIPSGKCIGLLGPNRAGKTTTLRMKMSGLPYLTFLASGVVASPAMYTASFEGMHSVYTRMVPQRTYEACSLRHQRWTT